jgi:hypothetical protein
MITKIDKNRLVQMIIAQLTNELIQAQKAANDAHADAVDDQSVAETQYDTLAIEAGYLAEGQSKRVAEFQQAIIAYKNLILRNFTEDDQIALTALVQLSADVSDNHWFFIAPAAGGFRCQLKQGNIDLNITVITPNAPMTLALLGKQQEDDIEIILGNNNLTDYIAKVY